jgi:tetratricopeptide (TPR) repeat protein
LVTLYLKEEKYPEAVPYLSALRNADPKNLNVLVKLGLIQMKMTHYKEAIATFNSVVSFAPDSDRVHYYLGMCHEEMKNLAPALEHFAKVPAESSLFEDATLHRVYLMKGSDRLADAKSTISTAIQQAPAVASFYLLSASLDEDTKDIAAAVKTLEKAAERFPDNEKVRYYLGSLYDRQGQVDQGIAQMEAILKTNPNHADALNYIGYTWTVQGVRMDEAGKLLQRAVELKPDNPYIIDSWGWYLFTQGRVGEALAQIERAHQLKPEEPTILEHLGDIYLSQNMREKAMSKYADAHRYQTDDVARSKIQAKLDTLKNELGRRRSIASEPNRGPATQPVGE